MEMVQEIIDKMIPECQFRSSTQFYPNQILALANAVISATAGNSVDCYSVLLTRAGPERLTRLKTLMQVLDPVKNKLVFSEEAFKVVCDAWSVLSDLRKKTHDDKDTSFVENRQNNKEEEESESVCTEREQKKRTFFNKKDNALQSNEKESEEGGENTKNDEKETFWTVCPYCYNLYEYEKVYEECCLRCENCRRGFQGVAVAEPKSDILVEGRDEYFCGVGFFALNYYGDATTKTHGGGGGGMCESHSGDDVIVISDSSDDDDNGGDESMNVNNGARKDDRAREEIVKGNAKSGKEGCLNGMQGSGKAEEGNGWKRRVHVKSVGRKSKVKGRPVKSSKIEGLDQNVKSGEGFKGDGRDVEIGSGSGIGDVDGCLDSNLEFFEQDGDVFVGIKFDG